MGPAVAFYALAAFVLMHVVWNLAARRADPRSHFVMVARPPLTRILLAGVFIGNAYALVILAMRHIPAAYAVAFTNVGIALAGIIAIVWYRERESWRSRLAASIVICAGLWLLAVR